VTWALVDPAIFFETNQQRRVFLQLPADVALVVYSEVGEDFVENVFPVFNGVELEDLKHDLVSDHRLPAAHHLLGMHFEDLDHSIKSMPLDLVGCDEKFRMPTWFPQSISSLCGKVCGLLLGLVVGYDAFEETQKALSALQVRGLVRKQGEQVYDLDLDSLFVPDGVLKQLHHHQHLPSLFILSW